MPSVNEDISDLALRHQVGIMRLGTATLRKLIPILNKADVEIVKKLQARDATLQGSFTSKRLASLLKALKKINHDAHVELNREIRKDLGELASYEAGFQKRMIQAAMPIQLDIVSPSAKQLNAIVNARPFQGKLLKDWLSELEASRARRVRDAVRMGMVEGETTTKLSGVFSAQRHYNTKTAYCKQADAALRRW